MSAPATTDPRLRSARDRYLGLIGAGDETAAVGLVIQLLDGGLPAETILLDLIGPAQAQVGQLWADNRWSVAREHAATAISERAMAAVAARASNKPVRGRIVVACVDGEWHALPVRMLADILRLRGWQVDFLGANVPAPRLLARLRQIDADTVALSCMLPTRLPNAHAAIAACQATGVPVIAGGRGFGADGRHARLLGAGGWAARADTAADQLAAPDWPPAATSPPQPPHFAGAEYHRLVRRRPTLIEAALRRLAERYPPAAAYQQRQRESTVEDFGHILDFLAAALYVDDATVFTDFSIWTAQVLTARGVPKVALTTGLGVFGELLADQPIAATMLARSIRELQATAAGR